MAVHSKIGASSMYRWVECPASVRLSKDIVSHSSVFAQEGTDAHDYASEELEAFYFGKPRPLPNEVDTEATAVYVDYIKDIVSSGRVTGLVLLENILLIEHKFDLSVIHPGLFGTGDCVFYDESEKMLHVIDYKHGQGIPVEVLKNKQLMYYGLGALLSTGFPCETVRLTVVQPRCFHTDGAIRSFDVDAVSMLDFAAELKTAALKTEDPKAEIKAGDHCRFCPASPNCPELNKKALALAKFEFAPNLTYDPKKLSEALDWLPTLEAWVKRVREFAYQEADMGRSPQGYKLVEKRAVRKWILPEAEIAKALVPYTEKALYTKKLLSPAQAEKLLAKEDKKIINTLIKKESSGYTLVHESDKRPSKLLTAQAEFGVVKE